VSCPFLASPSLFVVDGLFPLSPSSPLLGDLLAERVRVLQPPFVFLLGFHLLFPLPSFVPRPFSCTLSISLADHLRRSPLPLSLSQQNLRIRKLSSSTSPTFNNTTSSPAAASSSGSRRTFSSTSTPTRTTTTTSSCGSLKSVERSFRGEVWGSRGGSSAFFLRRRLCSVGSLSLFLPTMVVV
jgi:hypothetical protein